MGSITFHCNPLFQIHKAKPKNYLLLTVQSSKRVCACLFWCMVFIGVLCDFSIDQKWSLFQTSAPSPSLFHSYPLYIVSIFFRPSLYIIPTAAHTHTQMQTYPLTFLPSSFLLTLSCFILYDPLSFSAHISSKASSQVTVTLISLTAAKRRRLESTHKTHTYIHTTVVQNRKTKDRNHPDGSCIILKLRRVITI